MILRFLFFFLLFLSLFFGRVGEKIRSRFVPGNRLFFCSPSPSLKIASKQSRSIVRCDAVKKTRNRVKAFEKARKRS